MSCLFLSLPTYISWYLIHNHYLHQKYVMLIFITSHLHIMVSYTQSLSQIKSSECIGHIKQHFITNNPSHMSPTTFESQKNKIIITYSKLKTSVGCRIRTYCTNSHGNWQSATVITRTSNKYERPNNRSYGCVLSITWFECSVTTHFIWARAIYIY